MIGFQRQWRAGLMNRDIFQRGKIKNQYSLHPLRGAQSHPFGAGSQFPSFHYSNPPSAVVLLRRTGCERSELSFGFIKILFSNLRLSAKRFFNGVLLLGVPKS